MPLGGKLVLKGGETIKAAGGVEKKKKKKSKAVLAEQAADDVAPTESVPSTDGAAKAKPVDPTAVNVMSGKTYEQEFDLETKRGQEGKVKNTPWGSSFRAPPEILHGYTYKVTGKTAEERLDLRAAKKADKYCK